MTITELLKSGNYRLAAGDTWLVWDEDRMLGSWVVYQRKAYERNTRILGEFPDADSEAEAKAVAAFLKADQGDDDV